MTASAILPPGTGSGGAGPGRDASSIPEDGRPGAGRLAGFVGLFLAVATGIATFSALPWTATPPGDALLKVAVKYVAAPADAGVALSREELEKLPRHMRPAGGQDESRGRRDTTIRVTLDGRPVLERTYRPSGFRGDGPTFVYEEVRLVPGRHRLEATLSEVAGASTRSDPAVPLERRLSTDVDVESGRVLLLEFSSRLELILR